MSVNEYSVELKHGMKCIIIDTNNPFWNSSGLMDEYIGRIVTIDSVQDDKDRVFILEDNGDWIWQRRDFVPIPQHSIYFNSMGG